MPVSINRAQLTRTPNNRARAILAQDVWTTAVDEASGATYYYNGQTGESQWEPPAAAEQDNGAQILWRVVGSSGTHSRYSLRNGDVQVLSRFNMLKQKLTVSRVQCIVQIHDGTATLTSCGRGPTLWCARGCPWVALENGDQVPLTDGDLVSLDCNDPGGTVFACEERALQGGQPQMSGHPQGHQQGVYDQQLGQPQLPYPWEMLVDHSGAVYYANAQTGVTSWDAPQQDDQPSAQGGYSY